MTGIKKNTLIKTGHLYFAFFLLYIKLNLNKSSMIKIMIIVKALIIINYKAYTVKCIGT